MSGKCPKATEKKLHSRAQKPFVKAKAAKEAASDSETTTTKKTPKTKGRGKKVAELAEDSSDGEESLGERGSYFQIKLSIVGNKW